MHINDLKNLQPSIEDEFNKNGNWVISKSAQKFSSLPVDQAHEQKNKNVKHSGGAVRLCENPSGFRQWILAGPETARLLDEFRSLCTGRNDSSTAHHKQGPSHQERFQKLTDDLLKTITRMGKSLEAQRLELLGINSLDCASQEGVENLRKLEEAGRKKSQQYVRDVVETGSQSIHKPIPKNNLLIFRKTKEKPPKQRHNFTTLRKDFKIFT